MKNTVNILSTSLDRCQHCYQCVRRCPVKAIRLTETVLEIDADRCVYCGACVLACRQGAIFLADDTIAVKELLAARPTVVVLAPEIDAAFPDVTRARMAAALKALGFYAIEDMVMAEEMVASAYVDVLSRDTDRPVIRSTCPAVVNYVEMYLPEMVEFLAKIATPMIVQGRLIKSVYGEGPAVVFAGPCIAKKMEIHRGSDQAVDVVITFEELGKLFAAAGIIPAEISTDQDGGSFMARAVSAPGGFPLSWLSRNRGRDRLIVSRSLAGARETLAQPGIESAGHSFLDLLNCRGCIDGPAFSGGSRASRLSAIGRRIIEPGIVFPITELAKLPSIDVAQDFLPRPVEVDPVTSEELKGVLAAAGLADVTRRLDCAVCGYNTCVDQAHAVAAGFSDWSACFPYQRRMFGETTARLKEVSNTDGQTGLVNHRGFVEALANEFHRHVRYRSALSLIMIDVDNFKLINDTHGHLQGDKLLKLLAQLLIRNLRETDVAARYGGDEFAVILPQIGKDEAVAVAEKLRLKAMSAVFWLGREIKETVSLSLGVSEVNEEDADPMALLIRADKLLYKAKNSGRNQTVAAD
ncbi:MAG: diguanylate cyclase [Actinomycetota bacterium]|nr:diguanylate cyclase [Actinomycetota bacterium]